MVCVFLTERFEEIEAVTVIDILRRAKLNVLTVSVTGSLFVVGSQGLQIKADAMFNDTDFSNAQALILPGGPGTKTYNNCQPLLELLKAAYSKNILIAAICAAPTILSGIGMLDGKTATCYDPSAFPPTVTLSEHHTIKDGSIITSKAAATAPHFALAIVEALQGAGTAKEISEKMFYHLI
jgi:4-methyl-5(b-hydroxyethyl)-thiazole monophosphate biosynthesis